MGIELYPHNQKTYENIMKMWVTRNKVAVVQPTGSGKSFLILKCAETFNNNKKIILAPSNYILEQLDKHSNNIKNIRYITYAKLQYMTEEEINALNIELLILDEFHRCGAEEWGNGVQRLLDSNPAAKVLGTSATPIRYLDNARDMSDEIFDGNIACNMTLPQAIVEGILPMPKYVSALYTFEEEANNMINKVNNSKNSEEEKLKLIKDINKLKNRLDKSKGIPQILDKHIRNPNGRYIVFCKNKEHLDEMKILVNTWFNKYFKMNKIANKINNYEVYSDLDDNDIKLQNFINDNSENAVKLLFCINMLNEGLHISNLDGVILLRPTISPIMYYQQIGRAIDAGRKEEQTLILDLVNNFSSIKTNTLKEDLENEAKEYCVRNGISENDKKDFYNKFRVYDETFDAIELFSEIESRLYDNWELNIKALEQYYKREGNTLVPPNHIEIYNETNVSIGKYVVTYLRRNDFYKNLNEERVNQLNKLNFIWVPFDYYWEEKYNLLKSYYKVNGTTNVPQTYVEGNIKLGKWVNKQSFIKKVI